ncbi:MAG: ComEC family competence protein [Candidatus Omnitrophica bacterium]|nr:ComEC family competence protein [Candidatus Omnitrophota bacterium]
MLAYPLISLSLLFCLGIIVGFYIRFSFLFFYVFTLIDFILGIIFYKKKISHLFIFLAVFLLGILSLKNSLLLSNCHIKRLISNKTPYLSLVGIIESEPVYQKKVASFILRLEGLKIGQAWLKSSGKVLIRVFRDIKLNYGERLYLSTELNLPVYLNRRGFKYQDYLKRKGIYYVLNIKKENSFLRIIDKDKGDLLKRFILRLKGKIEDVFEMNLSFISKAILKAIILGQREEIPYYVKNNLIYSGTLHIIAISGLHLGIVVFIVLLVLKIIKIPRKVRFVFTILILFFYCGLTQARPSVVRATIMSSSLLLSYFFKRPFNIYNTLALAGLIILLFSPLQLFEVGFQLSFLSVIFIVWLSPLVKSFFLRELKKLNIVWIEPFVGLFSVSLSAWLGLLPLISYYFKIFSPITVLANMIIVPYMTIIVAAGFALLCIAFFLPFLSFSFSLSIEFLISILLKINYLLVNLPGAYFRLSHFPFLYILLYYLAVSFLFGLSHFLKTRLIR